MLFTCKINIKTHYRICSVSSLKCFYNSLKQLATALLPNVHHTLSSMAE